MNRLAALAVFCTVGCSGTKVTIDTADPQDTSVDPGCDDLQRWYLDQDGDGFGNADVSVETCEAPDGYVDNQGDCDDTTDAVNPDAAEVCDSEDVDEDCDGDADDDDDDVDPSTQSMYYADDDRDGYGLDGSEVARCEAGEGTATVGGDCDDGEEDVNPGASEVCDDGDVDEDCDGVADDDDDDVDPDGMEIWYPDGDCDGCGDEDADGEGWCDAPEGWSDDATDCDDSDEDVNPDALEVCDSRDTDEDCDGLADEADPDVDGADVYYVDSDGDGYGDASDAGELSCDAVRGSVTNALDCDDDDGDVYDECLESWDGDYSGTFEVEVAISGFGISDTCSGDIDLTVDEAAGSPTITGTVSCSWAGVFDGLVGDQEGEVEGDLVSDPDAEGDLVIGDGLLDVPWEGSFSGDAVLKGTFSGDGEYLDYSITYDGKFKATR